jgi:hypothetical protein
MKLHSGSILTSVGAVVGLLSSPMAASGSTPYVGFNFYGVDSDNKCYLKDMNNTTIKTWTSTYTLVSHAYLLRDSSVLFPCKDNKDYGNGTWGGSIVGGMPGGMIALPSGRFQIIKWDGTIAWDFPYHGAKFMPHHDCYPHYFSNDPKEIPHIFAVVATLEADSTIAEKIVEFKPTGKTTADIVWEWKAYDHMTTNGAGKPELLDINKGGCNMIGGDNCTGGKGKEWLHANHVRYNPMLDQVLVNFRYLGEFVIIDHSTTTAQAATNSGGKYGKGGGILYRWGNPSSYGVSGTQYLNENHGTGWIPNYLPGTRKPLPGAGHILAISNSDKKGYEIVLPNTNGVFSWTAGKAFEPASPLWTLAISAMGGNEGSMQRLPNGNTLVCNGINASGVAEFDSTGKSLWTLKIKSGECHRIDSAFLGSTLLDTGTGSSNIIDGYGKQGMQKSMPFSFQAEKGEFRVFLKDGIQGGVNVALYSATGRNLFRKTVFGREFVWQNGNFPEGVYFFNVTAGNHTVGQRMTVLR